MRKVAAMSASVIRCRCGRRITSTAVLRQDFYKRFFGPSFTYLRYRCPQCQQQGEAFIEEDRWDENLLQEEEPPPSP